MCDSSDKVDVGKLKQRYYKPWLLKGIPEEVREVCVNYAMSHEDFYVMLLENQEMLKQMGIKLRQALEDFKGQPVCQPISQSDAQVGDWVCVKGSSTWYRAEIVTFEDKGMAMVRLLDKGRPEVRPFTEIYPILNFDIIPPLVKRCSLGELDPNISMSTDDLHMLKQMLLADSGFKCAFLQDPAQEPCLVKLFDTKKGLYVREIFLEQRRMRQLWNATSTASF